jgi:Flp pilus assembly pilin Flp
MHTLIVKLAVKLHTLATREEGQNLVEYTLVLVLVAFGATAAVQALGKGLDSAFTIISNSLASSLT